MNRETRIQPALGARPPGSPAAISGIDAFAFTHGIAEHCVSLRERMCARWLGIEIDARVNATHATRISAPSARVCAFVIPTYAETVIASATHAALHGCLQRDSA